MDEEQYRVEDKEEEDTDSVFLRPLPTAEAHQEVAIVKGKKVPIVNFLGMRVREDRRDLIVVLLMPMLVGIVDATIFSAIAIMQLPDSATYMFFIPALIAIPIGLTVPHAGRALIGAILATAFFALFFNLFLISPAFISSSFDIGSFIFSGLVITSVYILFVSLASLLGTLGGLAIREFF